MFNAWYEKSWWEKKARGKIIKIERKTGEKEEKEKKVENNEERGKWKDKKSTGINWKGK